MSNSKEATVTFMTEDEGEVLFHVLEETKINGVRYLLVLDDVEDEDSEALILRDTSDENAEEAVYNIVEDEKELVAVAAVFEELLDDVELVTQD